MLGNPGGGGGGGGSGMFEDKKMEESFKEFINRPENRPRLEAHQFQEMKKHIKETDKMRAYEFRNKVIGSDFESQKNIHKFLKYRPLRKVIQTLTNDPRNDFDFWAQNPQVIAMLEEAKKMLDEGRMTELEMEDIMLKQFQDPSHEAHQQFKAATSHVARLPTEQLVGALNEHLTERRKGNDAYLEKDFKQAMHHYTRALSIVNLIQGLSSQDQIEVLRNKVAVLSNIAAVHMGKGEYGKTVQLCTEALEIDSNNSRALLRRAKANILRHENESSSSAPCLRFLTPAAAANEPKVDKRGAVAAANSAAKAASAAEQWTAKCAQATSAVSLDLEQSLAKTAEQAQVQSELSALEDQAQRAAPTEGQGGEVEDDEVEIFDEEDEDDDEAECVSDDPSVATEQAKDALAACRRHADAARLSAEAAQASAATANERAAQRAESEPASSRRHQ
eukprot:jgi/Tetstr1/465535/TSEL_010204.t1